MTYGEENPVAIICTYDTGEIPEGGTNVADFYSPEVFAQWKQQEVFALVLSLEKEP